MITSQKNEVLEKFEAKSGFFFKYYKIKLMYINFF